MSKKKTAMKGISKSPANPVKDDPNFTFDMGSLKDRKPDDFKKAPPKWVAELKEHVNESPPEWNMGVVPEASGWKPPEDRSVESQRFHESYIWDTPNVDEVFTSAGSNAKRPRIWQVVKTAIDKGLVPDIFIRNGQFKNISQIIGSCVGFGAGNMLLWASLLDAIIRNQPERILVPFVPYHYGRGRKHSGIRGKGSGSFGSGQAKALQLDGYLAFDMESLPKMNSAASLYWSESIEYQWSDGNVADELITEGRKHLCPTVVRVTSTEEARRLADNFYVFTIASSWGGRMQCPVKDGVLLNSRSGTWNHQMWVLDYIEHPRLGTLWWIGNNWKYPHGKDPGGEWDGNTGAPEGGFYVLDSDLQWILSKQDSFGFADPKGFEDRSRAFEWLMG